MCYVILKVRILKTLHLYIYIHVKHLTYEQLQQKLRSTKKHMQHLGTIWSPQVVLLTKKLHISPCSTHLLPTKLVPKTWTEFLGHALRPQGTLPCLAWHDLGPGSSSASAKEVEKPMGKINRWWSAENDQMIFLGKIYTHPGFKSIIQGRYVYIYIFLLEYTY